MTRCVARSTTIETRQFLLDVGTVLDNRRRTFGPHLQRLQLHAEDGEAFSHFLDRLAT